MDVSLTYRGAGRMPDQKQLEHYADILIRVGLNVQPGQPVAISAPLEAAEFVRILSARAYLVGARHVEIDWDDPQCDRIGAMMMPDDALEEVPAWPILRIDEQYEKNTAFLSIHAADPELMKDVPPERLAKRAKAIGMALERVQRYFMEERISWLACSIPTAAWAQTVFPGIGADEAVAKLWEAIFDVMRMNEPDPTLAWQHHIARLDERARNLNHRHFRALHYRGPGTDLRVLLPARHLWVAAQSQNDKGDGFTANLPTEEVFTLPQRDGVDGTLTSTMPLAYNGQLIEGISLRFERGKIVDYTSSTGYETLKGLIETDEGSHSLGEIALVPHDSPISNRRHLFYNTLFDENASCHVAIGKAYPFCLDGGKAMSEEEQIAAGANHSITHVDFMIGSADLEIDGELADGTVVPVFRKGNWALES